MNVAANEFLQLSRNTHRHWEKLINVERQQRRRLEETVEALGEYILNGHNIYCLTCKKLFDLLWLLFWLRLVYGDDIFLYSIDLKYHTF